MARFVREIGTGPMGMDRGASTQVTAAMTPIIVRSLTVSFFAAVSRISILSFFFLLVNIIESPHTIVNLFLFLGDNCQQIDLSPFEGLLPVSEIVLHNKGKKPKLLPDHIQCFLLLYNSSDCNNRPVCCIGADFNA